MGLLTHVGRPLEGATVCMLVTNDVLRDARVRKEARSVAEAGADVTVIGVGAQLDSALLDEPYRVRLIEPMRSSTHRFWLRRVICNLIAVRQFERRMEVAAVAQGAHVYHANDLDTLRQAMRAAHRVGARLVYDAHELSTESGTMKWWERLIGRRRERCGIRRADAVMCVNYGIARELRDRYRVPLPAVVYNGGAERVTEPHAPSVPVRLLFQGQFFADRGLDAIIGAVAARGGDAILTLQGWGGVESELRALVTELKAEDVVRFVAPCGPLEVIAAAAEHDVGIINHDPLSLNHLLASPNKLFDYICAGLAVVAPDYPVFREILDDAGCGVFSRSSSIADVVAAVDSLVRDPTRIATLKRAAVEASHRYTWAVQAEVLVDLYSAVLDLRRK